VQLAELCKQVESASNVIDVDKVSGRIQELEQATLHPGFWDDQGTAQEVMAQISYCKDDLGRVQRWKGTLKDIEAAVELCEDENDVCDVADRPNTQQMTASR
jgi:hypothetical protein